MAKIILALGAQQEATAATAKKKPAAKKAKDPVAAMDKRIKALQTQIAAATKELNELVKKKAEHNGKDIGSKLKAMKVKTTALRGKKDNARRDATHAVSMKHKSNKQNALHSVTLSKVDGGHAFQVFSKAKTISNPNSGKWRRESVGTHLHATIPIKNTPKGLAAAHAKAMKVAEKLAKKKMSVRTRLTK